MTTIPLNSMIDFEPTTRLVILCIALAILDFVLKWIAAYKAWTRRQIWWFVCLFIFNTCGILPIIYFIINKEDSNKIN